MKSLVPVKCPSNILVYVNGCCYSSVISQWDPPSSSAKSHPGHYAYNIVAHQILSYFPSVSHSVEAFTAWLPKPIIFQSFRARCHLYFLPTLFSVEFHIETKDATPVAKLREGLNVCGIIHSLSKLRLFFTPHWLYLASLLKASLSPETQPPMVCAVD